MSAVRNTVVKTIQGGRLLFANEAGDFKNGMFLRLADQADPILMWAVLGVVCGDLDALLKCCCSMGQNANLPCPLCLNVCSLRSGWADAGGTIRAFNCLEMGELRFHTDETIREALRSLRTASLEVAAGRMAQRDFHRMETEMGWHHEENNVLLDWFHIFNYELAFAFVYSSRGAVKIKWENAKDFATRFIWPRRLASPAALLTKDRVALSLYPVLALFMQDIVAPLHVCEEVVASFLALCDVLDMLVHVQEGLVTPTALQDAILHHLTLYKAAYGEIGVDLATLPY